MKGANVNSRMRESARRLKAQAKREKRQQRREEKRKGEKDKETDLTLSEKEPRQ